MYVLALGEDMKDEGHICEPCGGFRKVRTEVPPKRYQTCGAMRDKVTPRGVHSCCDARRASSCTVLRAMDDDVDDDSQSELAGSLSWWMMKSLWKEDSKLRLLLADTILLEDGHLMHWLFTSSKSGRVLKVCSGKDLRLSFPCTVTPSPCLLHGRVDQWVK